MFRWTTFIMIYFFFLIYLILLNSVIELKQQTPLFSYNLGELNLL